MTTHCSPEKMSTKINEPLQISPKPSDTKSPNGNTHSNIKEGTINQEQSSLNDVNMDGNQPDRDSDPVRSDREEINNDHVELSEEDKRRIYKPWNYSVIIKLTRKKLNHIYLRQKLTTLWRIIEEITLINLGHEYFIIKLLKEESTQRFYNRAPGL